MADTAAGAWTFRHLERKTDRDDALRVAEPEAIGQLTPASPARKARAVLDGDGAAFAGPPIGKRT